MPVPSSIADLSTTPNSNYPSGGESPNVIDDHIRSLGAIVKQNVSKGSNIASASTITIPNDGCYFTVTGTTNISAIANSWIGRTIVLNFAGALTLVHSSALILPGAANFSTSAGATYILTNEGVGIWRMIAYSAATNAPLKDGTGATGTWPISISGNAATATSAANGGVTSVAGRTGAVSLAKADVGLGNVDNTADASKTVNYAHNAGALSGIPASSFSQTSHNHNGVYVPYGKKISTFTHHGIVENVGDIFRITFVDGTYLQASITGGAGDGGGS